VTTSYRAFLSYNVHAMIVGDKPSLLIGKAMAKKAHWYYYRKG